MESKIFDQQHHYYQSIETGVICVINSEKDIVSVRSLGSTRAIGDAIQDLLEEKMQSVLPSEHIKELHSKFAKRSMADFAFEDNDDNYYIVDFKTHNLNTSFSMPNLTSVQRIAKLYEDDSNFFTILLVSYKVTDNKIEAVKCDFVPIEHLSWDCLTIGALGWGQIQIMNSNKVIINRNQSRKGWMLNLCDTLESFYPREIEKISKRIKHFKEIRKYWEKK